MNGFVCITKKETLRVYSEKTETPKDLVFIDNTSYAGYYSEAPGTYPTEMPNYAFFALQKSDDCREDFILRAAANITKRTGIKFSASYSVVTYLNKHQPTIRIDLEEFGQIPKIAEEFNKENIYFLKHKQVQDFQSIIKIKKYLNLNKIAEGVYAENRPNHFYIEVPKLLDWMSFEDLVISVKGTKEFERFDAALATRFSDKNEITEYFRIYTELFKPEDLEKLRNTFVKRMERL